MMQNQTLRWYDRLSVIHDLLSFNDWPYRDVRKQAIKALNLEAGDTVIDLFCGTGINFASILEQIGGSGRLIGIDGSAGMLARARKRIVKKGWQTEQITLIEKDLLDLPHDFFTNLLPGGTKPKVLITLALGVFPNYEKVFTDIFSAMPRETRFAILEGYCEEEARGAWLINLVGHSDCRRRVWEPIKMLADDYQEAWYAPNFKYIKVSLVVAAGVKRR